MKKIILLSLMLYVAVYVSCDRTGVAVRDGEDTADTTALVWNGYRNVDPAEIGENPISLIRDGWMLITAGEEGNFNTMTASWGAMGCIWSKPVALITVRNTRYTYEFLQDSDYFTLSFFEESYKPALTILGTRSGRDGDKVAESGLTPMGTEYGSVSFAEASMIIECRKLYEDALNPRSIFDDEIAAGYIQAPGEAHQLFIGEILDVWIKE